MRKSLTGVLVAAAAVGTLALAAPAAVAITVNTSPNLTQQFTPAENQASTWGDDCYKLEPVSTPFYLSEPAAILVLKSGTKNDIWYDAAVGYYGTASGKQISHVIVCPSDEPSS